MRRTFPLLKGSKGLGWYQKFLKEGQQGFEKYKPPTPFDWNAPSPFQSTTTTTTTSSSSPATTTTTATGAPLRPRAFFDIKIENDSVGRLVFELANDIVPKTVENFVRLCRQEGEVFAGYKDSKVHLIRRGEVIMAGDIENHDGTGNHSSYKTRYINDEYYIIPHTTRGLISMASVGVNTSGSQFYLTLQPASHLNGRCVAFGRVVEGDHVLTEIEKVFTAKGVPVRTITIENCGTLDPATTTTTTTKPKKQ